MTLTMVHIHQSRIIRVCGPRQSVRPGPPGGHPQRPPRRGKALLVPRTSTGWGHSPQALTRHAPALGTAVRIWETGLENKAGPGRPPAEVILPSGTSQGSAPVQSHPACPVGARHLPQVQPTAPRLSLPPRPGCWDSLSLPKRHRLDPRDTHTVGTP